MAYIGTSPSNGVRRKHTYTATANQTSFTGNDDNGVSLVYVDTEYLDVYQNGVKLVAVSDYASTTGTSVVLTQGASVSDIIEIIVFDIFSVADTVSAVSGGNFGGTVGFGAGIASPVTINGATPTLTIGDAGAEDTKIVFDGNAQDYHIGLDDSADTLVIGKGSALGTTTAMSFDANGIITKPLQPCFLVGKSSSAAQNNIANGSDHTVTFDTEIIDKNADFSSNTFTAPVTGSYYLSTTIRINGDSAANYYYVQIKTSNRLYGVIIDPDFGQDFVYWTLTVNSVADMDANDTAYVVIQQGGGSNQADIEALAHWTFFSGYLIA